MKKIVGLSIGLIVLFLLDLALGSSYIPLDQIVRVLTGGTPDDEVWRTIVLNFRLPRAVTATLVGAGLAVCGLQMQVLFRNPLAGPYVLGISSGASLGVALVVLAGVYIGIGAISHWITTIAAAIGSALLFLLILTISSRVKDSMTLLIFGLMFGSATGAIVSVLQFFSKAEDLQIYLLWTFGNLGGVTYNDLLIMVPVVLIGILVGALLTKSLNALLLGETYALSLGINVKRSRIGIIASSSILAGTITAFCGPIAFIGIAMPHLTRVLLPTSDHKVVYPVTLLMGGIALLFCDILAQLPGSQHVLPINAVTALVGAPIVIWIVLRKGNVKKSLS